MTLNKISCYVFLAIMLTMVSSVSLRAASDSSLKTVESSPVRVAGQGSGSERLMGAAESSSDIKAVHKRRGNEPQVFPQPAKLIPGKIPFEYSWKTRIPFEISRVEGFTGVLTAGNSTDFYVEAHSPLEIEASPKEGFWLTAKIFDDPPTMSLGTAHGVYDEEKHAWLVTITAPDDVTKSYDMELILYCAKDDSRCAEIYGKAARITKTLRFQLQSQ